MVKYKGHCIFPVTILIFALTSRVQLKTYSGHVYMTGPYPGIVGHIHRKCFMSHIPSKNKKIAYNEVWLHYIAQKY